MIYVVGDSHVRSFSYSRLYVPLFVARGKQLTLNNENEILQTFRLLEPVVQRIPENNTVILLLGEPSLRSHIEGGGTCKKAKFVQNYVKNLRRLNALLRDKSLCSLMIMPPVPRADDIYGELWLNIVLEMEENDFPYARIFNKIVNGRGVLKSEYVGDFIHANENLCDFLSMAIFNIHSVSSDEFGWKYQYDLGRGVRIWGGVPMDFLRYSSSAPRNWSAITKFTSEAKMLCDFVSFLASFYYFKKKKVSLVVVSEDESFFARNIGNCFFMHVGRKLRKKRFSELEAFSARKVQLLSNEAISVASQFDFLVAVDLPNASRYNVGAKNIIYLDRMKYSGKASGDLNCEVGQVQKRAFTFKCSSKFVSFWFAFYKNFYDIKNQFIRVYKKVANVRN